MQERREIRDLRAREIERRHPLIGTADSQELAELLAVLVGLDERRPREIRSTRPAARVGAVAEAALIDQQFLSALDRRRIGLGRERLLLRAHMSRSQHHEKERKGRKARKARLLFWLCGLRGLCVDRLVP